MHQHGTAKSSKRSIRFGQTNARAQAMFTAVLRFQQVVHSQPLEYLFEHPDQSRPAASCSPNAGVHPPSSRGTSRPPSSASRRRPPVARGPRNEMMLPSGSAGLLPKKPLGYKQKPWLSVVQPCGHKTRHCQTQRVQGKPGDLASRLGYVNHLIAMSRSLCSFGSCKSKLAGNVSNLDRGGPSS